MKRRENWKKGTHQDLSVGWSMGCVFSTLVYCFPWILFMILQLLLWIVYLSTGSLGIAGETVWLEKCSINAVKILSDWMYKKGKGYHTPIYRRIELKRAALVIPGETSRKHKKCH